MRDVLSYAEVERLSTLPIADFRLKHGDNPYLEIDKLH
jgi:hypothetical protein